LIALLFYRLMVQPWSVPRRLIGMNPKARPALRV